MGRLRAFSPQPSLIRSAGVASGLVLGSGFFAWQVYSNTVAGKRENVPDVNDRHMRADQSEFITLPSYLHLERDSLDNAKEELKTMVPKHLRKPWKLLRQANWGDYEKHLTAVRDLAALSGIGDGEMAQIAQSGQMRTAVGLARTRNVDLRFFLKPPPLPPEIDSKSTPKLFEEILSELPQSGIHDCIKFFTTEALENYVPGGDDESIRDSDLAQGFQHDSHYMASYPRRRFSEKRLIDFCLQALLSHSTIRSHCAQMIEHRCLPLFIKILNEHPDSPTIKSLIGKIVANVSLYGENHAAIYASGFVGILAKWKQDPNLLVTLPATKALANLDQSYGGEVYQPGIYLLLPDSRTVKHINELSNWGVDVVFIHGLLGGVFYSWRQYDPDNSRRWGSPNLKGDDNYSYCWPRDWLADMSDHVRVVGVDFDSYLSQWGRTCPNESFKTRLNDRSADILEKLRACGVGKNGRRIIFVGHSMGGLIVKRMLEIATNSMDESLKEFVRNTKGIVFYSTPHCGSRIAKMNSYSKYLFFPTVEVQDLEFESPHLMEMHQNFVELVKAHNIDVVSFGELLPTPFWGVDLTFVPRDSSDPGVGRHYEVDMNHVNVCKPSSRRSLLFRKLQKMLWNVLDDATPFE